MFDSAFFSRFPQQWSSFTDDHGEERRYQFPSFYQGSRGMAGIFSGSWAKVRAALPSSGLVPVPAGPGKALVALAAMEYNCPRGMEPYREVLFALPVFYAAAGCPWPGFGLFVKRLIVDRPENVQRGKHLWGMDKSLGEFKFFDQGPMRVCEVYRDGRRALRFEVNRSGRTRKVEKRQYLLTEKDGKLWKSLNASAGRESSRLGGGKLTLGADPFAVELAALDLPPTPLLARFMAPLDQVLTLPLESIGP